MIHRSARNRNSGTTFVTIGVAGLLALGVMIAPRSLARGQTARPSFEVASVKLKPPGSTGLMSISPPGAGRFTATNVTLELLIGMAFGVDSDRISGQPNWLSSAQYDVIAKPEGDGGLTSEQLKPLLQQLLEQRFKLAIHREMKDFQGYALVVANGGPRLQASQGSSGHAYILRGGLRCQSVSVDALAGMLSRPAGRPVVDATGLKGNYDITLDYAPEGAADSSLPSLFTALQEQLGLKLVPRKVPAGMLVIDHVERVPTEN
jgi:uncharacterized protein (TIGR03435 family)